MDISFHVNDERDCPAGLLHRHDREVTEHDRRRIAPQSRCDLGSAPLWAIIAVCAAVSRKQTQPSRSSGIIPPRPVGIESAMVSIHCRLRSSTWRSTSRDEGGAVLLPVRCPAMRSRRSWARAGVREPGTMSSPRDNVLTGHDPHGCSAGVIGWPRPWILVAHCGADRIHGRFHSIGEADEDTREPSRVGRRTFREGRLKK